MPTFNLLDDSFTRANVAAGGFGNTAMGNGWIDEQGNTFSISSNQLLCASNAQGMHYSRLLCPSSMIRRDQQVIVDFPTTLVAAQVAGACLRVQGDSISRNSYACQVQWNANVVQIWRTTWPSETGSIAVSSIASAAFTFVAGHQYELTFTVTGASPTTLTATLVDVTNSNTTVATLSTTDSTAGFQSAGYAGVFGSNTQAAIPFSRVRINDMGAASLVAYGGSPATVGGPIALNSTGNVITLVGNTAAWTAGSPGTPTFTLSGGTGASITSQTVIDANHATVTISAGSTAGALTITDPSTGLTTTVNVGGTVGVTDANLFLSPYNWYLSGSTYAQAANGGSYFKTSFSGTSLAMLLDLSPLTAAGCTSTPASTSGLGASGVSGTTNISGPKLKFSIDNGPWQSAFLNATGILVLASGLTAGTHSIECYLQDWCGGAIDRWATPSGVWRITGFRLDPTAATSAPTLKSKRMLLYGDSITEGKLTIMNPQNSASYINDPLSCYSLAIAQALSAEVGICAYSGQATIGAGGTGATNNVPPGLSTSGNAAQTTWDKYDANHSRLVGGLLSPAPDYIVNNMGTNDASSNTTNLQAGYLAWLTNIRAAAPNALIFCFIPLNQNPAVTYIKNAINAFADPKVYTVDLGAFPGLVYPASTASQASSDGTHPTAYGHLKVAGVLAAAIQKQQDNQGGGSVNPSTKQRHFS